MNQNDEVRAKNNIRLYSIGTINYTCQNHTGISSPETPASLLDPSPLFPDPLLSPCHNFTTKRKKPMGNTEMEYKVGNKYVVYLPPTASAGGVSATKPRE